MIIMERAGYERLGREVSGQEAWRDSFGGEEKSVQKPEEEKAAAKQEIESEIARLWEGVTVAEKERESFLAQIADLQSKIATDEKGDARVNGERIKALREYEGFLAEVNKKLKEDGAELKKLEAQYATVFGTPVVH